MPSLGGITQLGSAIGKIAEPMSAANHGRGIDSELQGLQGASAQGPMGALKGLGGDVSSMLSLLKPGGGGGGMPSIPNVLGNAAGLGKI